MSPKEERWYRRSGIMFRVFGLNGIQVDSEVFTLEEQEVMKALIDARNYLVNNYKQNNRLLGFGRIYEKMP